MNKLWDKFGNWFRDMSPMKVTILFMLAFALGLCLMKICFIAPYPPGIFTTVPLKWTDRSLKSLK